jgi:hypothetical protein
MSIPGPHGRTRQVSANAAKESAPPGRGRQGMPARVLSRYTAKKRAVIPAAPPRVKTRAPHGGPVQMTERNRSTDAFKVGGLRRSEKRTSGQPSRRRGAFQRWVKSSRRPLSSDRVVLGRGDQRWISLTKAAQTTGPGFRTRLRPTMTSVPHWALAASHVEQLDIELALLRSDFPLCGASLAASRLRQLKC